MGCQASTSPGGRGSAEVPHLVAGHCHRPAWLGVSRTPVREAIARLVAEGFVEMAANRYTKVSSLSASEYDYASQFLAGLHRLALEQATAVDGTG
ncbi:hypothetical protein DEI84_12915 [Curtobacterium sp. MCBD17_023]|nr:hypothetical protein DEI84_12915 [Curtobacterium sp. MCBD17_023]